MSMDVGMEAELKHRFGKEVKIMVALADLWKNKEIDIYVKN